MIARMLLACLVLLGGCDTTTEEPMSLLEAAAGGDIPGLRIALEAGADLEARDARGRTALVLAATNDHVEVAKLLVAAGADANALDDQHDTPWLVTGVTGSVAMAEALLPAKPDINGIVNRYGGISVIPAAERGHVDYVRRVVELGINIDHVNNLGWTALLECVILGDGSEPYQEIARILVAAGADVSIPDRNGVDALAHARTKGYTVLESILRS